MSRNKLDIYVYAHWSKMTMPKVIGILSARYGKGRKSFSFEYNDIWIKTEKPIFLDPDIQFYNGPQYPVDKDNFGIIHDNMPDTWGRTLMKRRAALIAKEKGEVLDNLYETDFLLGVYDTSRPGGLRFKIDPDGPFLDNDENNPTPPWSSVNELQEAVKNLEGDDNRDIRKWLDILIAPGSSLGGARPKASIIDNSGNLWIAKFPSKSDSTDNASWEFLAYRLAILAGIDMSSSKILKISGQYQTFFTKRFDRDKDVRIHFSSAMTMTGNTESSIRDKPASYLEIAEFIQSRGAKVHMNLNQLWRRIIFNILISNTDDHLRNHGFLLAKNGWVLSPAYDVNPSVDKDGLALNIDMDNNSLDVELAKSVGKYFRLDLKQMDVIVNEVVTAVKKWPVISREIGINRKEIDIMAGAFIPCKI